MMKKFLSIILISICLLSLLSGCNNNEVEEIKKAETSYEIIKVMENVYVDYINDIYLDKGQNDKEEELQPVIEFAEVFEKADGKLKVREAAMKSYLMFFVV